MASDASFRGCVIGGRGGAGKTRLAVELAKWTQASGWLSGLLTSAIDSASLSALVQMPTPRLIVADYAEARIEHLEMLLPLAAAAATSEHPIRVLLLVRSAAEPESDWTSALRRHSDVLDSIVDQFDVYAVDARPLSERDRVDLFEAAAAAFVTSSQPEQRYPPPVLSGDQFGSPLIVVIAAYLAVHANSPPPTARAALFEELLVHEDRYWQGSATGLDLDLAMRRRIVALITLYTAESEADASAVLQAIPDLLDSSAERRGRLARWAANLYPGEEWWNPLEPDILGEHLVAACYADRSDVLDDVFLRGQIRRAARPLRVYARSAPDHPQLAAAARPVLTKRLGALIEEAAEQAMSGPGAAQLDLGESLAGALADAVERIGIDGDTILHAADQIPPIHDLVLEPLAIAISRLAVEYARTATLDKSGLSDLAGALNNYSNRLHGVGRYTEALEAATEAVQLRREDGQAEHGQATAALANALNSLSNALASVGSGDAALDAAREATRLRRRQLAKLRLVSLLPFRRTQRRADLLAARTELGSSFNTLANRFAELDRQEDALAAIEESVRILRRVVLRDPDPVDYILEFASALHNFATALDENGYHEKAAVVMTEVVELYRAGVADAPSMFEADLARALNNQSNYLGEVGDDEAALVAIEEAVSMRRHLVDIDPGSHGPGLVTSLVNLAGQLGQAGRTADELSVAQEAFDRARDLAASGIRTSNPDLLTTTYGSLAVALANSGLAAEAVELLQPLAETDPKSYGRELATARLNLAGSLLHRGRQVDSLEASRAAVHAFDAWTKASGDQDEDLRAGLMRNLGIALDQCGYHADALAAADASLRIYEQLSARDPQLFELELAQALGNKSNALGGAGRAEEAVAVIERAVEIARTYSVANPDPETLDLLRSLMGNLEGRLRAVDRGEDADRVRVERNAI